MSANIEAHGHMGSCPGYALLTSQGKATKPRKDEFRERVGTIIEKTLTGEASVDTCKDRIAETERVREKRRARIERGAVDVPREPGNKDDEQVAVRHADASGGYIKENQHEQKRMRYVQVSKRRSVRFEQESQNASASSDPKVALEYPPRGETPSRLGFVLVQKSCDVDDDVQISSLDAFYEKDGRFCSE